MDGLLEPIGDLFGGGSLSPLLIIAGVVALFIAYKAVKLVMKLVALGIGAFLLISTAPWSGAAVDGAAADCAAGAVSESLSGWQLTVTKRITVESISADASCAGDGKSLTRGTAEAKLRTFYDVPFQTWFVDHTGANATSLG